MGEPAEALRELRAAWNVWTEIGAPYEAARTRLVIADACAAVGDHEAHEMESAAARRTLSDLGVAAATKRDGSVSKAGTHLTAREVEVLVLVASGKTNRAIAEELFISEKTVASHVSHIFTKIDVTSRSAATAFAYDNGLVDS